MSVAPSTVDFGAVTVGSSTTKTVTVLNNGNVDWWLASLSLNDPAFRVSATTCGTGRLAVDAECTLDLTFAPSTAGAAGAVLTLT